MYDACAKSGFAGGEAREHKTQVPAKCRLASIAAPLIVPARALGGGGATPPSDRISLACIGLGWMGGTHLKEFLKLKDVRIVAVCDLDEAT